MILMMTVQRKHSPVNSCYNLMKIEKKPPQHQQKRYLATVNNLQPGSSHIFLHLTGPSVKQGFHRSGNGQGKILQNQGKVVGFCFESGKIDMKSGKIWLI